MSARLSSPGLRWWLAGGIALVVLKLWLVAGQTIFAIGTAVHDDRLFLNLADQLLRGEWLGPYDNLTLAKGPTYPLWVAGVFLSGLPLFPAQHLLYATAVATLTWSLQPWLRTRWLQGAFFVVLLFNPVTFEAVHHLRVFRQNILHSLVLLTVAGLLKLAGPPDAGSREKFGCASLAGISFAAFWLTREEGVWLLPLLGVFGAWLALQAWRTGPLQRGPSFVWLLVPALWWGLLTGTVSWLNYRHYGVFTTCEYRVGSFQDAYGALVRVRPEHPIPFVPVARETRKRLYPLSPAFAELQPYLEGQLGENWARLSAPVTGLEAETHEIGGGWFMWALRDAVALAGHAKSGGDAMRFYGRLAEEVNEACDRGRIAADGRRSGFLPPLSRLDLPLATKTALASGRIFCTLADISVVPPPSVGPPATLELFQALTRGRLSPVADGPRLPRPQRRLDHVRVAILAGIAEVYRWLIVPTGAAALGAFLFFSTQQIWRWKFSALLALNFGFLAAIGSLLLIGTLVTVTSFPANHPGNFSAAYPLWFAFLFTAWAQGFASSQPPPALTENEAQNLHPERGEQHDRREREGDGERDK